MMAAGAPRTLSPEWRRIVREVLIDQVRAECRRELVRNRPGARQRVAQLLMIGARVAGQIEAGEVGS